MPQYITGQMLRERRQIRAQVLDWNPTNRLDRIARLCMLGADWAEGLASVVELTTDQFGEFSESDLLKLQAVLEGFGFTGVGARTVAPRIAAEPMSASDPGYEPYTDTALENAPKPLTVLFSW